MDRATVEAVHADEALGRPDLTRGRTSALAVAVAQMAIVARMFGFPYAPEREAGQNAQKCAEGTQKTAEEPRHPQAHAKEDKKEDE